MVHFAITGKIKMVFVTRKNIKILKKWSKIALERVQNQKYTKISTKLPNLATGKILKMLKKNNALD